jgi:hypothetical protein
MTTGWSIVKRSWSVLRHDKKLMVFPLLSGLACLVVAASFVAPFLLVPQWGKAFLDAEAQAQLAGGAQDWTREVQWFLVGFAFYFVNYFVIVFFNTALAACAIIRFNGGDPTLGDGLRAAGSRLPYILGWTLLASTVGMILNAIESRSDWVGKIVVGLLGLVWTAATFLVVPVLAVERLGPLAALRRSVALLRQAWGEGLVGNFSLGLIGFLLFLPGLGLLFLGIAAASSLNAAWPLIAVGVVTLVYLVALATVMSTLKQIFLAGLYIYAAENRVVDGFSADLMRSAFKHQRA